MEQLGEPAFRDLETSALKETVSRASSVTFSQDRVIALGGGALWRDGNRAFAESNGNIVLLTAELKTLLERLNEEAGKRPLLEIWRQSFHPYLKSAVSITDLSL